MVVHMGWSQLTTRFAHIRLGSGNTTTEGSGNVQGQLFASLLHSVAHQKLQHIITHPIKPCLHFAWHCRCSGFLAHGLLLYSILYGNCV